MPFTQRSKLRIDEISGSPPKDEHIVEQSRASSDVLFSCCRLRDDFVVLCLAWPIEFHVTVDPYRGIFGSDRNADLAYWLVDLGIRIVCD